jgi:hypothetical protein
MHVGQYGEEGGQGDADENGVAPGSGRGEYAVEDDASCKEHRELVGLWRSKRGRES